MRGHFLFACCSVALGAVVACATSNEEAPPGDPPPNTPPLSEGGADAGAGDGALPGLPTCSSVGWCVTTLPDADLVLRDISLVQGHAFAVAESPTLGVKVLAWDDTDPSWKYIDDNTQNETGIGNYARSIWAPSDSEIYYTLWPGYIYHGKRAGTWTWERRRIPGSGSGSGSGANVNVSAIALHTPALGVWGTSADDVYVWHGDTIFHWKSADGGAPDWIPEYVLEKDSAAQRPFILGASGASKDDIWFAGGRADNGNLDSTCPVAIRKTVDGYRRIVDGSVTGDPKAPCAARPGFVWLGGDGWLNNLQVVGSDRIVGLRGRNHVTRIQAESGGGYSTTTVDVLVTTLSGLPPEQLYSLWAEDDEAWVSGSGVILRGSFESDASFAVSTIARNGLPIAKPLFRLRGTDKNNLWAIGAGYALHKTTP